MVDDYILFFFNHVGRRDPIPYTLYRVRWDSPRDILREKKRNL